MNKAILYLVFGVTLMITMGISSLLPILPHIARAFGLAPEASWMVITAFAFPGLVCIPLAGMLADRFGRKAVLLPSLVLFAISGAACAFAPSFEVLLLCRVVQGVGSSGFGVLYTTIIADTWSGQERVKAMSLNAMVLGIGTAVSPALSGALAMVDWRLPFALPLTALAVAAWGARLSLAKPGKKVTLKEYTHNLSLCVQHKSTLSLLLLTLLTFIMLSGPLITCFPLLVKERFSATPFETGAAFAVTSLAAGLLALSLPKLYRAFSTRVVLLAAMALYVAAFVTISAAPSFAVLLFGVMLYGAGQGANIPLVTTLLTERADDGQRASLMALNSLLLRLGQNVGPALFGTLAALFSPAHAFLAGALLAALTAVFILAVPLPSLDMSRASFLPGKETL